MFAALNCSRYSCLRSDRAISGSVSAASHGTQAFSMVRARARPGSSVVALPEIAHPVDEQVADLLPGDRARACEGRRCGQICR